MIVNQKEIIDVEVLTMICSNSNIKKDTYGTDEAKLSLCCHITAIPVPKLKCSTDILLQFCEVLITAVLRKTADRWIYNFH